MNKTVDRWQMTQSTATRSTSCRSMSANGSLVDLRGEAMPDE